jgi:hypothetical protein
MLSFIFACSGNIHLVEKTKTTYGRIKFYSEKTSKNEKRIKRIYASINRNGHRSYYSFYAGKIVKTTDIAKTLTYTVIYENLPKNYDTTLYQKLSSLDSFVLIQGDNLLDSLGLSNFKKSKGAQGYLIEINYYHGYPKRKKFKP